MFRGEASKFLMIILTTQSLRIAYTNIDDIVGHLLGSLTEQPPALVNWRTTYAYVIIESYANVITEKWICTWIYREYHSYAYVIIENIMYTCNHRVHDVHM